ncbi:MAG: ABC transporter permease [Candidatus Gastranaerophilales bacterium]|nr:ABC transporter permease [Candidatus Gastranaerophilales bacterium]
MPIRRIISLIKKEFILIWKDPNSRMLIIVPPLLQLFIFAHAATMEVRNIDMAVLDKSQTLQSRNLISEFQHSKWFKKIILVENENQVAQMIKAKKVQIALCLNTDFATRLLSNKQTNVQLILDGRQTNLAGIVNGYATTIIGQYEAQYFPKRNVPKINIEIRNWFNPNLIFLWYTVVSLVTILATSIALVLTALSIAREREMGTFDQLIVSPLSSFEILMGKIIPPLIISLILATIMGIFTNIFFQVPFVGSVPLYYFSMLIYLLSVLGIGLFISSICKTQQQAILGAFTFQMPAILLSGYISPVEDMPMFFQTITWLNPVRFFLVIMKGVCLKNMPAEYVYQNLIPLIFIAILTLSAASWMFKRNLD